MHLGNIQPSMRCSTHPAHFGWASQCTSSWISWLIFYQPICWTLHEALLAKSLCEFLNIFKWAVLFMFLWIQKFNFKNVYAVPCVCTREQKTQLRVADFLRLISGHTRIRTLKVSRIRWMNATRKGILISCMLFLNCVISNYNAQYFTTKQLHSGSWSNVKI
jgi:hypothetical protein